MLLLKNTSANEAAEEDLIGGIPVKDRINSIDEKNDSDLIKEKYINAIPEYGRFATI